MTLRTMIPLLLAVAGLATACKDDRKQVEAPKVEEVKKLEEPPALTAVAPAQPASIADLNTKQLKEEPKEEPKQEVLEISHAPEPESFDRPVDAKDVVIDRFVLASDVAHREPVEESDHFTPDTAKIFAFVQLANPDAPYAFTVHFEPVDGPISLYGVKLDVPSAPRFRTWAWTKLMHQPGKYRAVLRTLEGEEIAAREFTIDGE